MAITHEPNGALPLDVKTRAFITLLRAHEVSQGCIIVLALSCLDDPHALRTPQPRCQFGTNILQSLCRGFRCEMTGALQRLVGRAGDQIREAADFPGRDQQIDQRVEIGALGRLQGPCMPVGAIGFPKWTKSLGAMLLSFEDWLERALRDELTELPVRERGSFVAPLHKVQKQVFRALQQFRDRLSERTMRAFGVPLRTTETEIAVAEPAAPNIRIGRVFDRNWELLSPILPVWVIKGLVRQHFEYTIRDKVYQNLSRLASQLEESINDPLWRVEKEARRRLDELIATVERLVENSDNERASRIRADLERLEHARKLLAPAEE